MSNPLFIKAPFLTRKNFFNTNKTNNVFCLIYPFYLSPHQTQVLELKFEIFYQSAFSYQQRTVGLTDTYKQILGYRKYIYFTFLFRYFIFIVVLHYCNLFYFVATKITTNLHYFSIKTGIF